MRLKVSRRTKRLVVALCVAILAAHTGVDLAPFVGLI